ncbi:MAG TPA: hypothetical protein ACFYD7_01595 [Candidatus Wujingus californicus]|uniref:hypothetical protein n=1 Tax=Candidatus Wujingus californicus TaxID=3367618 RepID=UPI0027142186|nr:hypothetical protein [Candidatus Brocadiales bacterium]
MKTINPADVISYINMCSIEGVNLQRGMNFRLKGGSLLVAENIQILCARHNLKKRDKVT